MTQPQYPQRRYGENWDDYQDRLGSYHKHLEDYERYWEEREDRYNDKELWRDEEDDR